MSMTVFGIPVKACINYEFLRDLVKAMCTSEQWSTVRRGLCTIRNQRPREEWTERWVEYLYSIATNDTDIDSDSETDSDSSSSEVDKVPNLGPGFGLGIRLWDFQEIGQLVVGVPVTHDDKEKMEQTLVQVPLLYSGKNINRFGEINPQAMDYLSPFVCGPLGYYKFRVTHICPCCLNRAQENM